jgi:glycine dehydrogenase subunit 1
MNPYIANTAEDVSSMLAAIGAPSVDALFADIQPRHAPQSFDLPEGLSEYEVVRKLNGLSLKNMVGPVPFIGGGFYDHYVPAVCQALIARGEFYTAYTPYQPECSQGTLQALFEFQSSICALTGMDVSNASLYEGGTALYEAMMMALRVTGRSRIVIDGGVNPIYRKILRSYTHSLDIEFVEIDVAHGQADRSAIAASLDGKTAALIVSNPNFFGAVDDLSDISAKAHACGALVISSVYPVSLGLLKTPADMGVDIVTGEGQSLGLALNFGGPYLGIIATRKKFIRQMPGRIVGETVDAQGRRCFVNTLQAREQHIRREKATSNVCTNVALCATQAAIFMSLLGREGLKDLAQLNLDKAEFLKEQLSLIKGVDVKRSSPTFNEFTVRLEKDAHGVIEAMIRKGFAAGFPLGRYYPGMDNYLLIAVTEKRTRDELLGYARALAEVLRA